MEDLTKQPSRRGRPPKPRVSELATRELLLRAGLEVLTEKGFSSSGIDEILKRVGVPKGSFYHYFDSKESFGRELIDRYAAYFAFKLERHLGNRTLAPLARLQAFVIDAQESMAKHGFRRGCLIGNLGQEIVVLPESFQSQLQGVFSDWQSRFAKCLAEAQAGGELSPQVDCDQLAEFFWIGWEGAILRAKLERSSRPLEIFGSIFFATLPR